ncbi:hypothetical protein IWQ60_011504 [Tieghemiomyces parasiticus]|uniref:Acetoacetate-CoA ligase n=1 Tax=Tieghemiomyces parasiticus TaxID=78921 RepID=A0A9W7ZN73_9FUNG|nr:hypothetical protein IWQ60_011504 [Tieghemiomyces parasiticus]
MTDSERASGSLPVNPPQLWAPRDPGSTNMHRFMGFVNEAQGLHLATYPELYRWSCDHLAEFWTAVWRFVGVRARREASQVVDERVPMASIPRWFDGARLNFAENLLRHGAAGSPLADRVALISCGERRLRDRGDSNHDGSEAGYIARVTHRELRLMVARAARALRRLGVEQGDRVAGYLPNGVEAVVLMLAAASMGAIWCCTSPDFGTTGVLDRLAQIRPKVLFSVNAIVYNDKVYDHLGKVAAVVDGLPTLARTVVVPFVPDHTQDYRTIRDAQAWGDFMAPAAEGDPLDDGDDMFTALPFDHPLYILFSSGTTGLPKCLVHSAGGMLLQHLKEHVVHGNMQPTDVFLQYTTTGWMMWNWMVSSLAVGATLVLYDGSPFRPGPSVLWELVDRFGVTMFGTSAKYLQSLQDAHYVPRACHDLSTLHSIYSTGSPLHPESFDYVYRDVKADLCLGSITGGTDICSLFGAHNTALPVYRGEIQCRGLGMAVEALDPASQLPIYNASGDLVCTRPFPCMPVYFWNDDAHRTKYRAAYFDHDPRVWYHGDFVWINGTTGGMVMLGRSDGTLNPAGVRFGSAELYNILENGAYPEIADALAVGQRRGDDERVVLFLRLVPGYRLDDELVHRIRAQVRAKLSPRHVPALILETPEIPYTVNGKKVEVIVKKIISGLTVVPSATLSNPECLDYYRHLDILYA